MRMRYKISRVSHINMTDMLWEWRASKKLLKESGETVILLLFIDVMYLLLIIEVMYLLLLLIPCLKTSLLHDKIRLGVFCIAFVFCWQFDKGILQICLSILRKAFGFKMTPCMSDPVMVSRALSKIVSQAGCLSVCPSVRPSVRPSVCLSVCLSVCPSLGLSFEWDYEDGGN